MITRLATFSIVSLIALSSAVGCSSGGSADAGCDDAGNQVSDRDAGICRVVTRCDDQPFCPALVSNDPTHPNFLVTQIDIRTPATLLPTTPVGRLFNDNVATGALLLGLSIDRAGTSLEAGAMTTMDQAQSGRWYYDATYRFVAGTAPPIGSHTDANRWNSATTMFTASTNITGATIPVLTLPIVTGTNQYTELTLHNLVFRDIRVPAIADCIGLGKAAINSCVGGRWDTHDSSNVPYGVFEADILVSEAMDAPVPGLTSTLCNLTAGADCSSPQSTWRVQPDTRIDGATVNNAWHIVANFSAVAVRIGR